MITEDITLQKILYYRRYIDDIFAIFRSPEKVEKFANHFNSKHKDIKFSYEKESNNSLPFLDILISRSKNGFKKSVYPKPLLVEYVLSSIVSFITNITLVWFLLFSIASNFSRFHTEASHLKDILSPIKLVDNYTPVALTVEKKELLIVVPYLGNLPLTLRTCLQNGINKNLPY